MMPGISSGGLNWVVRELKDNCLCGVKVIEGGIE